MASTAFMPSGQYWPPLYLKYLFSFLSILAPLCNLKNHLKDNRPETLSQFLPLQMQLELLDTFSTFQFYAYIYISVFQQFLAFWFGLTTQLSHSVIEICNTERGTSTLQVHLHSSDLLAVGLYPYMPYLFKNPSNCLLNMVIVSDCTTSSSSAVQISTTR